MGKEVTILLVDDDTVDAEAIIRALRKKKILNEVVHVKNGQEAIDALRDGAKVPFPRLILLDLNMPRMNGIEFLKYIREDAELNREVVFVLTTSALDEDRIAAYDFNVAGYILKDNVGEDFDKLLALMGAFWRVVEFPDT
jgi:CheY-like chemotaxis protein